ncbi:MAG: cold shock domain-containing protein [Patescibacteria group bacterium]
MTGTIARVTDKGFGFIKPDEGDKDVFFHAASLNGIAYDDLREGDAVTFDLEEGPKGPAAANVTRAEGGAAPEAADEATDEAA